MKGSSAFQVLTVGSLVLVFGLLILAKLDAMHNDIKAALKARDSDTPSGEEGTDSKG